MQFNKYIYFISCLLFLFSCEGEQTSFNKESVTETKNGYRIDKKDGVLDYINHFITVDSISYLNQYISFDKNGNIQKDKSHYYTLMSFKDTFKVNEEISLRIELDAPKFYEGMEVLIGGYTDKYVLKKNSYCDTIRPLSDPFVVFYDFKVVTPGDTTIRGCIINFSSEVNGGVYKRPVYFSKTLHITN